MNEPPQLSGVVLCSSVLAVPAFLQKGKNIVSLNVFIKLLEQDEHWNSPHTTQASALDVQQHLNRS